MRAAARSREKLLKLFARIAAEHNIVIDNKHVPGDVLLVQTGEQLQHGVSIPSLSGSEKPRLALLM